MREVLYPRPYPFRPAGPRVPDPFPAEGCPVPGHDDIG